MSDAFVLSRAELDVLHDWIRSDETPEALLPLLAMVAGKPVPKPPGPRTQALRARIEQAWSALPKTEPLAR